MKADTICKVVSIDFDEVLSVVKETILNDGFLIIHEINPQQILASYQIETLRIRQVLFFHPKFMKEIIQHNPSAIIEAPLKYVISEIDNERTMITSFNLDTHFKGYHNLEPLVTKLKESISELQF